MVNAFPLRISIASAVIRLRHSYGATSQLTEKRLAAAVIAREFVV